MSHTEPGEVKRILVVDDNQDNRELMVKILRKYGYLPVEAVDGEQALRLARTNRPDLVLLDISLPGLDGYQVAKRLHAMAEYRDLPIIAITAHAMKGDREKALAAGCHDYLAKPINVRELPERIARNLLHR